MEHKISKTNPARTVLTITIGILIIYFFTDHRWLLYTALVIGITGVFSAWLSEKIDYLWMKLAWLLGLIIPNIILGLVFYAVLFPLSVLSRLFGRKDFLSLKNRDPSLYEESNKQFSPASFEKPW